MKFLSVALLLCLASTGCSTTVVPVPHAKFPPAPEILLEKCSQLSKASPSDAGIRSLMGTVVNNYSLYHQCAEKVQGWQEWYNEQQKIFNKPH